METFKFSHLIVVLGTLSLLTLSTIAYFYSLNKSLKQEQIKNGVTTNSESTIQTTTLTDASLATFTNQYEFGPKVAEEFNKIVQEFDGKTVADAQSSVWWISNDNFNIINRNEIGLNYQNYMCESDYRNEELVPTISRRLSEKLKPLMVSFGFSFNQKNSSKSLVDTQFYDYVQAYEKGAIKCTFTVDPDCGSYSPNDRMHNEFRFTCTDSFNQNYLDQVPYLKGLNLTQSVISVERKVGDFAFVNVNYRRTGHYVIAKLVDGKWTQVFAGQGTPDCKTMQTHQVPQEIYENCYAEEDLLP